MKIHSIKSWPQFFEKILDGSRSHELRFNDREYMIGDRVCLREFDPGQRAYTGREAYGEITSITSADIPCAVSAVALSEDFCIFSLRMEQK